MPIENEKFPLYYSPPPPSAHTLLIIWPVENVVAETPDMMKAAEIMSATIIFRIVLLLLL